MQQQFLLPFALSALAGVIFICLSVWAFSVHLYWVCAVCIVIFIIDMFTCTDMYIRMIR